MTIYDIAKISGVSKSTVSRVINNDPKVSAEARETVRRVIRDNNYIPNKNARNLSKSPKKTILILMTRLNSNSENKVLHGIVSSALESCEYMIFETNFSIDLTKSIIQKHNEVDGIIIFAIGNGKYDFLEDSIIPVVYVGQKLYGKNSVYFNDYEAMNTLLTDCIGNVKSIMYIGIESSDPTTGKLRYFSVENFCNTNQIELSFLETKYRDQDLFNKVTKIDLTKFDAIICATDSIALAVYKHMLLHNKKDIILTGVGNNEDFNFIIDNFITIEHNYYQAGIDAFDCISKNKTMCMKENFKIIKY